jgi:hypothetical protein
MRRRITLLVLLGTAGVGLLLGLAPEADFHHAWLSLALISVFAASDASLWRRG